MSDFQGGFTPEHRKILGEGLGIIPVMAEALLRDQQDQQQARVAQWQRYVANSLKKKLVPLWESILKCSGQCKHCGSRATVLRVNHGCAPYAHGSDGEMLWNHWEIRYWDCIRCHGKTEA